MIIGDVSIFAVESEITRAFERLSLRGLGFFVIHVAGRSYGIKAPGQSMLACSIDEVQMRIARRGSHQAAFSGLPAIDIAEAYIRAVYLGIDANETFFGLSEAQFTQALHSNSIVWAPDGDEAFDDGSYVLQFDIDNQVRVIAFQCPDALPDPSSVREVWLHSEIFYAILGEWNEAFIAEWKSLPKHD